MDGWIEASQNIFDRAQLRYKANLTMSVCPSYAKPIMCESKVVLIRTVIGEMSVWLKCESSVIVGMVQLDF